MPRSEKDNEEIRATRRREILEAATEVFARKGVARTKVTDIAAAAKLSHGLLYHYFPSKEAVFEAVVEEMMQRADEDLRVPQPRAIDRLMHSIRSARDRLDERTLDATRAVTLALLMGDVVSDALRERMKAHMTRLAVRTHELVAQAQAEGDLDDSVSADEVARLMVFLFRGMAIRVPGFPVPLPDVTTLLRLLRPVDRAPRGAAPEPRRDDP
ncbi:MAG: TetR/AcrR family transcriptional regulator [Myxococcales bacterium]|nr:TetR/AcrR family transcriptional regulator [Myxococcales bacterium]